MRTVFYGPFARLADLWHGWRDGKAGIPEPTGRRVSTPHREVLIRRAQEAFDFEWSYYERGSEHDMGEFADCRTRLAHVEAELRDAEAALADFPQITESELTWRGPGEARRSERVTRRRRGREHEQRRRQLDTLTAVARGRVGSAEVALATALDRAERHLRVGAVRVRRVHDHAHRRMATYRRVLVRTHRDGRRVKGAMDPLEPRLPLWVDRLPTRAIAIEPSPPQPTGSTPPRDARSFPFASRLVIGSSPAKADIVIEGYEIGPAHAVVERGRDGIFLRDLGSGTGTFQHGRKVLRTGLVPGDSFDIGDHRFTLGADAAVLHMSWLGECDLVVHDVSGQVIVDKAVKPLLTSMSFVQRERSVLAIIGPSGAGKSTLFSAIVGELSVSGALYFRGMPVTTHLDQLRPRLGYVPQDEHLPANLTVRQVLHHTDRWRRWSSLAAGSRAIDEVCGKLDITPILDQVVDTLSGGQRKRVSIAMELLGDPHLLMLDEPTSGLDPGMDRDVMIALKEIADAGCTVIVVTHSTQHLGYSDQVLVVASQGRPVYSGAPSGLPSALGDAATYADLMKMLTEAPELLVAKYQEGPGVDRTRRAVEALEEDTGRGPDRVRGPFATFIHQFPALVARQVAMAFPVRAARTATRRATRRRATLACVMPFILAVVSAGMAALVSASAGLGAGGEGTPTNTSVVLSVLTTLSVLVGQALTYSNLVEEFEFIRREHRTGLLVGALLLAKWVTFAGVAVAQAAMATGVFVLLRPAPVHAATGMPPTVELFVDIAATTVAAMSVGLVVSAAAKDLKQAVILTSLSVIAQVTLNGVTKPLSDEAWVNVVAMLLFPARWGLAASAVTVDLRTVDPLTRADALWTPAVGQWVGNLTALGLMSVGYLLLAVVLLRRGLRSGRS